MVRELERGVRWIGSRRWGPVEERRYRLRSGFHVELNYATADWAAIPLDPGTAAVLSDGSRILFDGCGLAATVAAMRD